MCKRIYAGLLLLAICSQTPAEQYKEAPRYLYARRGGLTPAASSPSVEIAQKYLRGLTAELGLPDNAGLYLVKQYRTEHNGITHLHYRQRFHGLDVERSNYVINIDRDGRIIGHGGALFPSPKAGPPTEASANHAVREAVRAVNPKLSYTPARKSSRNAILTFEQGSLGEEPQTMSVWYPIRGQLHPAWKVQIIEPDGKQAWSVLVASESTDVLRKDILTLYFGNKPRGLVFERESPQPNSSPGVKLSGAPRLVERTLQSFTGDVTASPKGWISTNQTTGNNVIAGLNPSGSPLLADPPLITAPDLNFSFPLALGLSARRPSEFPEAAVTNLFYWANRAHDWFYEIGFDEQAGNYQVDNFGKGGEGGDPMYAYAHFGTQQMGQAAYQNALFTTRGFGDGQQSGIHMFLSLGRDDEGNIVEADGAYAADVILHEYAHGVSTRLVHDLNATFEGAAMGEAWSDFFAVEFLTPEGAPVDGTYITGEYFTQKWGTGIRAYPYSTDMSVNPLTYAMLGRVNANPSIHDDGGIWFEALWEMRARLIGQFGEREGRRRTRMLVIDGMKLSPPAPSMIDARDAILLADRANFEGASQQQIWEAFAKRGLGVLAQSDAESLHVAASFEVPGQEPKLGVMESKYVIGEPVRIVLSAPDVDTATARVRVSTAFGDSEDIVLRRSGILFKGALNTNGGIVKRSDGNLNLIPGDSIQVEYTNNQQQGTRISVPTMSPYTITTSAPDWTFAEEEALLPKSVVSDVIALVPYQSAYALPFDFQFFERNVHGITVEPSGVLGMNNRVSGITCLDGDTLRIQRMIAPLMLQAMHHPVNEQQNIFVSKDEESITFRWATQTMAPPPSLVNAAATLYKDGRIKFRYGPGNDRLANRTDSPCYSAATVGISNGHGVFKQEVLGHNNQMRLTNAATVTFWPPFNAPDKPHATLETPLDGAPVHGVMTLKGLAWDDHSGISRIDVIVDDVALSQATLEAPRGWKSAIDLQSLGIQPGEHALKLRVTNWQGAYTDLAAAFRSEAGEGPMPIGRIESPAPGDTISSDVVVKGYVYIPGVQVRSADLLLDGLTLQGVDLMMMRPDVCETLTEAPNCPRIGFETRVIGGLFGNFPNGTHTLALRVIDESGRSVVLPETVAINVEMPPSRMNGVIESIQAGDVLSGIVTISGRAWNPDGKIDGAAVYVDGGFVKNATFGAPTPDAFAVDLDTRSFTNGPHRIAVVVFDQSSRRSTLLPKGTRDGLAVIINNP